MQPGWFVINFFIESSFIQINQIHMMIHSNDQCKQSFKSNYPILMFWSMCVQYFTGVNATSVELWKHLRDAHNNFLPVTIEFEQFVAGQDVFDVSKPFDGQTITGACVVLFLVLLI
jgi:hypothetical protein